MDTIINNSISTIARINSEMNELQPTDPEYVRRKNAIGVLYSKFRADFGDQFVADVFYGVAMVVKGVVRAPEWVVGNTKRIGSPR